ncbi:prephenate dehydrogenase [Neomoorella humiferrea]|uniref:prephenate dehydrogenase/arogenate dehydrogenase family protein n=1 Tax=Neomoorella humiferrea TaxID=676965 RepID=UPI003D8A7756
MEQGLAYRLPPGSPLVARAAVIGLGLIGGSLGLALVQGGLAQEVVGYDRDGEAVQTAVRLGAVTRAAFSSEEAVAGAEIVFLAVPVGSLTKVAAAVVPFTAPGAIVTDTGSVKGDIVYAMENIFHSRAFYIGGHPMAGSEKAGIKAADRYLLENAVYVLTPTQNTDSGALSRLQGLLKALGARVITMDPEEHDLVVAGVSHLPHLLAVSLMQTAGELSREHPITLMLAAGGFRDTTRIAAGNPEMWRDIFLSNRQAILKVLQLWRRQVEALEGVIAREDAMELEAVLQHARHLRNQVPARQKGLLPTLHEIVVTVPDRPGVIGRMASALGGAGINIIDLEILRVREGEGGSIRLAFTTAEAAAGALEILQGMGINARIL